MEDTYKWFTAVSPHAREKIKQEIEDYVQYGMGRCKCGPLAMKIVTDPLNSYFKTHIRCKCGITEDRGNIEGEIPFKQQT